MLHFEPSRVYMFTTQRDMRRYYIYAGHSLKKQRLLSSLFFFCSLMSKLLESTWANIKGEQAATRDNYTSAPDHSLYALRESAADHKLLSYILGFLHCARAGMKFMKN
jgi:hypothetical protein